MGSAPSTEKPSISGRPSIAPSAGDDRRVSVLSESRRPIHKFNDLWNKQDDSSKFAINMTKHHGFSQNKINVPMFSPVFVSWSEPESTQGLGLRQITFDGDKFVAVKNGWTSGPLRTTGNAMFRFGCEGEFKLASIGVRSTPLSINVTKREDYNVTVTDDGFKPSTVFINEGTNVVFRWSNCLISHSVWPISYCPEHGGFTSLDPSAGRKTPGTYFFNSEAREFGTTHLCIVSVRPVEKEHVIRIFDTYFDPGLLEIEQGDRVWWQWDAKSCKTVHCVFEVEMGYDSSSENANQLAEDDDENKEDDPTANDMKFKPKEGGFRWYGPSKYGYMSQPFQEPGIYFFADLKFDEISSYVGTIVVRPKSRSLHFVEISNNGFATDNLRLMQGDQVWFLWNTATMKKENIALMEFERCLTPMAVPGHEPETLFWRSQHITAQEYSCEIKCHRPTSTALKSFFATSAFAIDLPLIGVYHFRLPIPNSKALSVICNRATQVCSIRVMKNGFKPKMLMVCKGDIVCWSWSKESGQHVIYEVSNAGQRLNVNRGGFWSGPKRGLDSAFLYVFNKPGVYYFSSEAMSSDTVGTIVVLDVPEVTEIPPPLQELMIGGLPVVLRQNSVACWSFMSGVVDDTQLCHFANGKWQALPDPYSSKQSDSHDGEFKEIAFRIKRRCLNRSMTNVGLCHLSSKTFQRPNANDPNEPGVVSLIVDQGAPCSAVVYLDAHRGFVPSRLTLRTGDSVVFDWLVSLSGSNDAVTTEAHNVFLVSGLDSDRPMSSVGNISHFMHSGQPVADSTFLTTFRLPGTYTFASQGAPGMSCIVTVSDMAVILRPPQFNTTDLEQEIIDQGKKIMLRSLDDNVDIYYSCDGSRPHPASPKTFKYQRSRGVLMHDTGPAVVRAVCVSSDCVWSEVAISRLWIVIDSMNITTPEPEEAESPVDEATKQLLEKEAKQWRAISLSLRAFPSSQQGAGEVLWSVRGATRPSDSAIIESYQLYINNVLYSAPLSSTTRGVSVVGMVGGRTYAMHVEAHAAGGNFLPIKSNSIVLNLPLLSPTTGGPLMGVEFSVVPQDPNPLIALTWPVVEAARLDLPITSYLVFVNGRNVASVTAVQHSHGLTHHRYALRQDILPPEGDVRVAVVAKLSNRRVYSNELKLYLPLSIEEISPLPRKNTWLDYLVVMTETAALASSNPGEGSGLPENSLVESKSTVSDEKDVFSKSRRGERKTEKATETVSVASRKAVKFRDESTKKPYEAEAFLGPQLDDDVVLPDKSLPSNVPPYTTNSLATGATEKVKRVSLTSIKTTNAFSSCGGEKKERQKATEQDREASWPSPSSSQDVYLSQTGKTEERTAAVVQVEKHVSKKKEGPKSSREVSVHKLLHDEGDDYSRREQQVDEPPYRHDPEPPRKPRTQRQTDLRNKPKEPVVLRSRSSNETTTSGTTSSSTSTFSSPREFSGVELTYNAKAQDDLLPVPSASHHRSTSPSSVATTVTHRSEQRYAAATKLDSKQKTAATSQTVQQVATAATLHSIREGEIIDIAESQTIEYQRVSSSRNGVQYLFSKPPNRHVVPNNKLLEALVENDFEQVEEYDERSVPFVEDKTAKEPVTVSAPSPAVSVSDLPIPMVQVIDESTSRVGEQHFPGQVLVKWHLDALKLIALETRGLEISTFFLSVTGRLFADRISSHLSFDVAPEARFDSALGETLLRHQWVLPGPGKDDDDVHITNFSQVIDGLTPGEEYSVDVICEFVPLPAYTGPSIRHREVTSQSSSVHFRCQGPPPAPKIAVKEIGIGQVTFTWSLDQPDFATGYNLLLNGKISKKQVPRSVSESTLDGLVPGSVTRVSVVALNDYGKSRASHELRIVCADKPLSPEIEEQPNYSPAKSRGILIGWSGNPVARGSLSPRANISVTSYRVYVDGKLDGIVRRSEFATRHGYQYLITNVIQGRKYEILVRAVAGEEPVESSNIKEAGTLIISCPSISDTSNLLVCSPPTAPQSPRLRVENMTILGVDLAWDAPAQQLLVPVTGYQVLKNNRIYGTSLPAESTSIRIREVTLGETIELQLISLTDHPVGGGSVASARRSDSGVYSNHAIEQVNVEKPIGSKIIVQFTRLIMPPGRVWLDKITGRSAIVAWTHASMSKKQPPSHFSVATSYQVTWWSIGSACSAQMTTTTDTASPAVAVGDVCSQSIKAVVDASEQSFILDNLKTDTAYTVVVEGRLESSYVEVVDDEIPGLEERISRTLVLSAGADPIRFATGRPPDSPKNLAVLSTTCHSILVGWDPCVEHGVEVIALRVECSPIERDIISPHQVVMDLLPNATEALIDGLGESCDYKVSVIAITQEFFDSLPANSRWKSGKAESLPRNLSELSSDSHWLPRSVIECSTSGTFAADEIRIAERGEDWCKVEWIKPPRVVGTNRLVRIIVRWVKCERDSVVAASSGNNQDGQDGMGHLSDDDMDDFAVENRRRGGAPQATSRLGLWSSNIEVELGERQAVLQHLIPGSQYQMVVEAVVSVKVTVSLNRSDQVDCSNRRTVHVPSRPVRFWTRCLLDPLPRLLCSSLSTSSVTVSWDRPTLTRIVGAKLKSPEDFEGAPSAVAADQGRVIRMHLLGYLLIVNQVECQRLSPEVLSCTLTNCKSATSYSIEVVAQTCIDPVYKARISSGMSGAGNKKKKLKQNSTVESVDAMIPRDDVDENRMKCIHVKLPVLVPGCILSASLHVQTNFNYDRVSSNASASKVVVLWDANTSPANVVKQFSITYQNERTRQQISKIFDSASRQYTINNVESGTVYTVAIDSTGSTYPASAMTSKKQRFNNNPVTVCLQVLTPGPPIMPRLIVTRRTPSILALAWTDPHLYAGDDRTIIGFKIVLDDADYTELLPPSCHVFSLPVTALSPARRVCVAAVLTSPENTSRTWNLLSNAIGLIGSFAWSNNGDGGYVEDGMSTDTGRRPLPLPLELTDDQADECGGASGDRIDIRPIRVDDAQIVIGWNLNLANIGPNAAEGIDNAGFIFQLTYTCSGQPAEKFVTIPAHHNSHTLSPVIPGAVYKFHVMALTGGSNAGGKMTPITKRMALASSRELTVETPAPPELPKLRIRAVNFEYVTIEWAKPTCFGNAHITSYKVYVNSVLEMSLPSNQLTFTYSRGRGCSEYSFQVQAVAGSNYVSPLSEPLKLTWPGVRPPELSRYQASDEGTMVRVGWEAPYATSGVTIRDLFVHVVDRASRKLVHKVGPIHPDCREAEFINPFLSGMANAPDVPPGGPSGFNIFLEVCVAGVGGGQSFWSSPLPLVHSDLPPAPTVAARLLGLDDRIRVEQRAARLINRRDSVSTKLANCASGTQQSVIGTLSEHRRRRGAKSRGRHGKTPRDYEQHLLSKLSDLDRKLLKILMALEQYSGEAVVSLTVHIPLIQVPDIPAKSADIAGFRIFIDGKQLKTVPTSTTHPALSPRSSSQQQLHEVRVRLPVRKVGGGNSDRPHRINVACLSKTGSLGPMSSTVEVSTVPFRTFVHFCNFMAKPSLCHPTPQQAANIWPDEQFSQCRFVDVFRRDVAVRRYFANRLLSPVEVGLALDSCVFDLATRRTLFLRTLARGNRALVIVLFVESSICVASNRALAMFADFASALDGMQSQLTLIVAQHHHQSANPSKGEQSPLIAPRSKSVLSSRSSRGRRRTKRPVHPLPELDVLSKPSAGFSLLTSVECDTANPLPDSRRGAESAPKRLCELVRISGVPSFLILNGETETGWVGRFCALSSTELGAFLNHQVNLISGISCATTARGCNDSGPGCIHCSRVAKRSGQHKKAFGSAVNDSNSMVAASSGREPPLSVERTTDSIAS